MKKTALFLLTSAATLATAQDCCDPCEPCCVPKPKKCIDCECYTPAFYDLQCDWGMSLDVEFLYWYAGETHLPLASQNTVTVIGTETSFLASDLKYVKAAWDPGFRVGLGWNSECDGWDVNLTYTWYRNTQSTSLSGTSSSLGTLVNGEQPVISFWNQLDLISTGSLDQPFGFDQIKGKWKLQYNVLDLEMGRKYWLSKCFNLRPFIGLRGAWDKINFDLTKSLAAEGENGSTVASNPLSFTNNWWGVGVVGGIDPTFYFTPCFALYGQLDMALVWGKFKSKMAHKVVSEEGGSESVSFEHSISESHAGMQPMYTIGLGIRWEDTYCSDRYRFALDLGWEHNYLDEHAVRPRTKLNVDTGSTSMGNSGNSSIFDVFSTGLGLGGFVLRARFDF